jgi:hypothetical protein
MAIKNDRKSVAPNYREVVNQDDDVEGGSDDWNPTPAIFEGFLKRDFALCARNMQMALENARQPLSFKEMKEQLLHSADVIERVITSKIASGHLFENKGKYSLTRG